MKLAWLFAFLAVCFFAVEAKKTSAEWNKFVREGSQVEKDELNDVRKQNENRKFDPVILGMDFIPGFSERDRELAGRRIIEALRQASLHVTFQRTSSETPDRWVLITYNKDEAKMVIAFFKQYIAELEDVMRIVSEDLEEDVWNLPRFEKEMQEAKLKPKPKRKYGTPDPREARFAKLTTEEKMKYIQAEQEKQEREAIEL